MMKRPTTIIVVTLAAVLAAGSGACDIYSKVTPSGSRVFTNAPITNDYDRVIKEKGEVLPWKHYAKIQADRKGLDPDLVRAVIYVESGDDPFAVSSKGAMGLMQLMPGTAAELGVEDAKEPRQNVKGGVSYLSGLIDRFDGDWTLALAAYNAGPGAVERHKGVPPYPETKGFVKKVMTVFKRIKESK